LSTKNTKEGLKRVMNVPSFAATIVNNTLGAGIFVLPATVALQAGGAGILVYLFCAAMLVVIMLCYAEVGSRITSSGGSYIYVEEAFGPMAGFIVNCIYLIGWGALGSAALMNILGDSLAILFPVFSITLVRAVLFLSLLGFMALVNILGAKEGVRFIQVLTLIKLIPLVAIVLFGISEIRAANLRWEHLPPIKAFGETALVLFFAFAGFETSLGASGEIENPKRTIPRGILLGGVLVFVIYILIQTVTQGVLGAQISAYKDAPLAAVAGKAVGGIAATLVLIAAMISTFGNTSGDLMGTPRLLFAGAHDGLFPKFLGKVHPWFATPWLAIITYSAMIFVFSISGGFKSLAVLASGSLLLVYLGVVLAMIKFRISKTYHAANGFNVPGGLIAPVIAVVAIIWLLSNLKKEEAVSTLIFILGVTVLYFIVKSVKKIV
jgi:APA family basic amino acid/polyamine antiporter